MRQKEFRAPSGKVMFKGKQEAFEREPRDFDKTPPQGAELANMRSFGDVSLASSAIIRAGKMNDEELAALPDSYDFDQAFSSLFTWSQMAFARIEDLGGTCYASNADQRP